MAKKHPWLFARPGEKSGTRYYLRARVPKDLVGVAGRREIKISLKTSDPAEARARINLEAVKVDEQFAEWRRQLEQQGTRELSETEVRRMVFLWFREHDGRAADAAFRVLGQDRIEALADAELDEAALAHGEGVDSVANEILLANGWPDLPQDGPIVREVPLADVDRASDGYRLLVEHVRRGLVETARRNAQRLRGAPAQHADPQFRDDAVAAADASPTLREVMKRWAAERQPPPPAKTASDWKLAVRRFEEVNGDLPVASIQRQHVVALKDALVQVPAVLTRKLRKLPLPELVKKTRGGDARRLSAPAVAKQLAAVRALLGWAVNNGLVEDNVARGVTVAKGRNAGGGRVPYDADDMKKLFGGIAKFRATRPARFWLPLLAAYTGARLEEIGCLTVDDVRSRDGVDYIDVNAEGDKSVKTGSSLREVPLHPVLVRCGLLEYVAGRRAAAGDQLFPDLRADSHGKRTSKFSKWWTRYRREAGVGDPRKPFHSFRHAFKQACRAAGVEEEVHDAITGHAGGGVGRTYGGVPLAVKAAAVGRVSYGVDPSHLHAPDGDSRE